MRGITITGATETGIVNEGTLSLRNSGITNNDPGYATNEAGGVANRGTLTMSATDVSGNHGNNAGGIVNYGTATLSRSRLKDNQAVFAAGGILNWGT
jgi:hypothetical protein